MEKPFPPKSPPMYSESTTMRSAGISRAAASWSRSLNGDLFVLHTWKRSPSIHTALTWGSKCPWMVRATSKECSNTRTADARAASTSPCW